MSSSISITVLYETQSIREITSPDLGFGDGYILQDEFIDLSNPDKGVFWERSCIWGGDDTAPAEGEDEFMRINHRMCVVLPEEMPYILAIWVKGALALVRDPDSAFSCGLTNVMLSSMGIDSIVEAPEIESRQVQTEADEHDTEKSKDEHIDGPVVDVQEQFDDDDYDDMDLM